MFLSVPLTSIIQIISANIPSLKPVAIMLSEGRDYRKRFEKSKRRKKNMSPEEHDDIEMPEHQD